MPRYGITRRCDERVPSRPTVRTKYVPPAPALTTALPSRPAETRPTITPSRRTISTVLPGRTLATLTDAVPRNSDTLGADPTGLRNARGDAVAPG
jgi:hypothetical protein